MEVLIAVLLIDPHAQYIPAQIEFILPDYNNLFF